MKSFLRHIFGEFEIEFDDLESIVNDSMKCLLYKYQSIKLSTRTVNRYTLMSKKDKPLDAENIYYMVIVAKYKCVKPVSIRNKDVVL